MNRTYSPRASDIERSWFVVDATGQRLGTLASRVAQVLEGKHKPSYATHMDVGDHVIVLNAARVDIGRAKTEQKVYSRHSGYPGGLRQETLGHLLERRPEEVIRRAVKGMLPRTRLGAQQLRKLKIYAGGEHPHEAQVPSPLPGTKKAPAVDAAQTESRSETAAVEVDAAADETNEAEKNGMAEENATADSTTGGSDN
jgi:large subunit ribosomal protein L13